MEKDLNQLVEKLKQAAGTGLRSVVLYGSAASGEFQPQHSDLNVLCVLERLTAAELERLNPAAAWWEGKGHPAPLVFTQEELHGFADLFPIELLDIQSSRRVLYGEDVFAGLQVPMNLHREEVERELRTNLIRLRQSYLAGRQNNKTLYGLMNASVSTFAALFRHALIALGEAAPKGKREVVERLAALVGFDATAFQVLLDVREGKRRQNDVDAGKTFEAYLGAVTRVAEEVDRRLARPA